MRDVRGDQGSVVGMLARARADLALEPGIGEILVADRLQAELLRCVNKPGPHGEREPLPARVTQVGGDRLLESRRFHGLRDAAVHHVDDRADIDIHQNIGWRTIAFSRHALGEALLHKHRVDPDARFLCESVKQRTDKARLTRRVEIDGVLREGRRGDRNSRGETGGEIQDGRAGFHLSSTTKRLMWRHNEKSCEKRKQNQ